MRFGMDLQAPWTDFDNFWCILKLYCSTLQKTFFGGDCWLSISPIHDKPVSRSYFQANFCKLSVDSTDSSTKIGLYRTKNHLKYILKRSNNVSIPKRNLIVSGIKPIWVFCWRIFKTLHHVVTTLGTLLLRGSGISKRYTGWDNVSKFCSSG